MSAKDRRKSLIVRLDPALDGRLRAYARDVGARSLAAAVRTALRAERLVADDHWSPPSRPSRISRRPRPLAIQLEGELRAALSLQGDGQDAARVRAALRRRLRP